MSKEYIIGAKDRSTAKKYVDYLERAVRNGGKVGESYSSGRRGKSNTNVSSVDDYRGFYDFTFHALFDSSYNYVYSGINVAWKNYASIDDTVVGLYKKDGVVKKAKWDGNIFKLNDTYNQYYVYIDVDTGDIKVTNMERDEEKGSVLNGGKPCIVLFDFNVESILSSDITNPYYHNNRSSSYIDVCCELYEDVKKTKYVLPEYITEEECEQYTIGRREYICLKDNKINYSSKLSDENGRPYDVLLGSRVIDCNNHQFLYPDYSDTSEYVNVSYSIGSDYIDVSKFYRVPYVAIIYGEPKTSSSETIDPEEAIDIYSNVGYSNKVYKDWDKIYKEISRRAESVYETMKEFSDSIKSLEKKKEKDLQKLNIKYEVLCDNLRDGLGGPICKLNMKVATCWANLSELSDKAAGLDKSSKDYKTDLAKIEEKADAIYDIIRDTIGEVKERTQEFIVELSRMQSRGKKEQEVLAETHLKNVKKVRLEAEAYLKSSFDATFCGVYNEGYIGFDHREIEYNEDRLNYALYGLKRVEPYIKITDSYMPSVVSDDWSPYGLYTTFYDSYILSGKSMIDAGKPCLLFSSGRCIKGHRIPLV